MTVRTINTSLWPHKAVVYQIYPRSFKDGNNDGIGDLKGIIQNLDYLNDGTENSLGVDAIWLSPIYKSPMADFGYDVADYTDIDPIFGDLKDFDTLVTEAHARNISIIMDYIPNHTSSLHSWFVESKSSRTNSKRDWYIWRDGKPDGSPPNNWLSRFGGSAWEYDETTKQYYLHTFVKEQPDLNWQNPEVEKAMLDVLRFWLDRGVDGFRADAIDHILKDPHFLDEPEKETIEINLATGTPDPFNKLDHIYTMNQPGTYSIIKKFSQVLGEYENKFMVNEVNINIEELLKFYESSQGVCIPFNFKLMFLPWNAREYQNFIEEFDKALGSGYSPTYVLGNHDCARLATRLTPAKARLAAMLQLTLRGIPFIYYGDEIGMENGVIPAEKVQDPWEKKTPGLNLGRDPARTPMKWTNDAYAGFSEVEPWLPVSEKSPHVSAAQTDTHSMLNLYKQLIHFRKKSHALLMGTYETVKGSDKPIFVFERKHDQENVMVALNFSDKEQVLSLKDKKGTIICNSYLDKEQTSVDLENITLRPNEGYVVRLSS